MFPLQAGKYGAAFEAVQAPMKKLGCNSCSGLGFTHRPLRSSFLWFIFGILQGNPKKELLRGLWVGPG